MFVARDVWDTLAGQAPRGYSAATGGVGVAEIYRALSKRAFIREAQRYVPQLQVSDAIRAPAGVRAQAVRSRRDARRRLPAGNRRAVLWVRNAPSPAATSSLAIAEETSSSGPGLAERPFSQSRTHRVEAALAEWIFGDAFPRNILSALVKNHPSLRSARRPR